MAIHVCTGCPISKVPLCFACFLGFLCSYRGSFYHFSSPGDEDSKTHLTFLPTSKIDQVTEQNVRQIGFRYNLDKLCMYQKTISKSSLPHILLCNLIKFRRREESKVSFGIVISWAVEKG